MITHLMLVRDKASISDTESDMPSIRLGIFRFDRQNVRFLTYTYKIIRYFPESLSNAVSTSRLFTAVTSVQLRDANFLKAQKRLLLRRTVPFAFFARYIKLYNNAYYRAFEEQADGRNDLAYDSYGLT